MVVSLILFLCRASSPHILESLSVERGGHTLGAVSCASGLAPQETPAGPVSVCLYGVLSSPAIQEGSRGSFVHEAIEVQNTYFFSKFSNIHQISIKSVGKSLPPPHLNSLVFTCWFFFFFFVLVS